jgi:hypothetical protein
VCFAVTAALLGRPRRAARVGPGRVALALLMALVVLAAVVSGRGPAGLGAEVGGGAEPLGHTPRGSLEITGRDLAEFPLGRRVTLRWTGELRARPPVATRCGSRAAAASACR